MKTKSKNIKNDFEMLEKILFPFALFFILFCGIYFIVALTQLLFSCEAGSIFSSFLTILLIVDIAILTSMLIYIMFSVHKHIF
jgi:hypothetical protein